MPQQDSISFVIADLARLMRRAFQTELEGSSLTLAQARALVYLSRHEGIRQVDLAELLEVQPITLARQIDQLAVAGLIERRPDLSDRRANLLYLLPAAAQHLDAIRAVGLALQARITAEMDPAQVDTVMRSLNQMRDKLCSH